MAALREIRIRARIDSDGLPIDIKNMTGQITDAFGRAAGSVEAVWKKAAQDIVSTMSQIGRTPVMDLAPVTKQFESLNKQLGALQKAISSINGKKIKVNADVGGAAAEGDDSVLRLLSQQIRGFKKTGQSTTSTSLDGVLKEVETLRGSDGSIAKVTKLDGLKTAITVTTKNVKDLEKFNAQIEKIAQSFTGDGIRRLVGVDPATGNRKTVEKLVDEMGNRLQIARTGNQITAARVTPVDYAAVQKQVQALQQQRGIRSVSDLQGQRKTINDLIGGKDSTADALEIEKLRGQLQTVDAKIIAQYKSELADYTSAVEDQDQQDFATVFKAGNERAKEVQKQIQETYQQQQKLYDQFAAQFRQSVKDKAKYFGEQQKASDAEKESLRKLYISGSIAAAPSAAEKVATIQELLDDKTLSLSPAEIEQLTQRRTAAEQKILEEYRHETDLLAKKQAAMAEDVARANLQDALAQKDGLGRLSALSGYFDASGNILPSVSTPHGNYDLSQQEQARIVREYQAAANRQSALDQARKNNADYLYQNGYRPVQVRNEFGPDGRTSITEFKNSQGAVATLNSETQKLSETLPKAQTLWERFKSHLPFLSGENRNVLGFFGDLAAKFYVLRGLMLGFETLIVGPIERLSNAFISANENSRKFEIALSGITGSRRAQEINAAIIKEARTLPLSIGDLRETGESLAALPAFAARLQQPSAAGAVDQITSIAQLTAKLGSIDPIQGNQGSLAAVREVYEGGGSQAFTSLRRRFGITAQSISRALGQSVNDIRADPNLAIKGLEKIVDTLIPDSALKQSNDLITTKIMKVREAIQYALVKVGNSGAYDDLAKKFDGVKQAFESFFDSDEFNKRAKQMSDSLVGAADSISDGIKRFTDAFFGHVEGETTLGALSRSIAGGLDWVKDITKSMPELLSKLGELGAGLRDSFVALVDGVTRLADAIDSASSFAGLEGNRKSLTSVSGADAIHELAATAGISLKGSEQIAGYLDPTTGAAVPAGARGDFSQWAHDHLPYTSSVTEAAPGEFSRTYHHYMPFLSSVTDLATGGMNPTYQMEDVQLADFSNLENAQARAPLAAAYRAILANGGKLSPDITAKFMAAIKPSGRASQSGSQGTVDDFVYREPPSGIELPNYGAQVMAATALTGPLSMADLESPIAQLEGQTKNALRAGENITSMTRQYFDVMDRLQGAQRSAVALPFGLGKPVAAGFQRQLVAADQGLGNGVQAITDQLSESAHTYAFKLADVIQNVPFADGLRRQILDGTTEFGKQVVDILKRTPNEGRLEQSLSGLPLTHQETLVEKLNQGLLSEGDLIGKIGNQNVPGRTAAQVAADVAARPGPIAAMDAAIAKMQEAEGNLAIVLNNAKAALDKDPGNVEATVTSLQAAQQYAQLVAQLEDKRLEKLKAVADLEEKAYGRRQNFNNLGVDYRRFNDHLTGSQVVALASRDNLTDRQKQLANVDIMQAELPNLVKQYDDAKAEFDRTGSDNARVYLEDRQDKLAEFTKRLQKAIHDADQLKVAYEDFAVSVRDSLENNLGNAIADLIKGTGSLRDALVGFANDIVSAFSRMAANQLLNGLLGSAGQRQGDGFVAGIGGLLGNALNSYFASSSGASAATAANGAVFKGGFPAFATGGIARKPMLGLIGEGRHPEAIVPMPNGHIPLGMTRSGEIFANLPGGRRISARMEGGVRAFATGGVWEGRAPTHVGFEGGSRSNVEFDGGGKATGDTYVVANLQDAVRHGFTQNRDLIVDITASDIVRGGKLAKATRGR